MKTFHVIGDASSPRKVTEAIREGFDRARRLVFDNSILHFWHAHLSQIYRELYRLEQTGLVTVEIQSGEKKPGRKVYSLTPEGSKKSKEILKTY